VISKLMPRILDEEVSFTLAEPPIQIDIEIDDRSPDPVDESEPPVFKPITDKSSARVDPAKKRKNKIAKRSRRTNRKK